MWEKRVGHLRVMGLCTCMDLFLQKLVWVTNLCVSKNIFVKNKIYLSPPPEDYHHCLNEEYKTDLCFFIQLIQKPHLYFCVILYSRYTISETSCCLCFVNLFNYLFSTSRLFNLNDRECTTLNIYINCEWTLHMFHTTWPLVCLYVCFHRILVHTASHKVHLRGLWDWGSSFL